MPAYERLVVQKFKYSTSNGLIESVCRCLQMLDFSPNNLLAMVAKEFIKGCEGKSSYPICNETITKLEKNLDEFCQPITPAEDSEISEYYNNHFDSLKYFDANNTKTNITTSTKAEIRGRLNAIRHNWRLNIDPFCILIKKKAEIKTANATSEHIKKNFEKDLAYSDLLVLQALEEIFERVKILIYDIEIGQLTSYTRYNLLEHDTFILLNYDLQRNFFFPMYLKTVVQTHSECKFRKYHFGLSELPHIEYLLQLQTTIFNEKPEIQMKIWSEFLDCNDIGYNVAEQAKSLVDKSGRKNLVILDFQTKFRSSIRPVLQEKQKSKLPKTGTQKPKESDLIEVLKEYHGAKRIEWEGYNIPQSGKTTQKKSSASTSQPTIRESPERTRTTSKPSPEKARASPVSKTSPKKSSTTIKPQEISDDDDDDIEVSIPGKKK